MVGLYVVVEGKVSACIVFLPGHRLDRGGLGFGLAGHKEASYKIVNSMS